jgi:pectate lyase
MTGPGAFVLPLSLVVTAVACGATDSGQDGNDPSQGGTASGGAPVSAGTNSGGVAGTVASAAGTAGAAAGAAAGGAGSSAGGQAGGGAPGGSGGTAGSSAAGSGGAAGNGSAGGSGGAAGSGPVPGEITVLDAAPGFASVQGGTTGGGKDLASAITVSSMSALQDAAESTSSALILVEPGNYSGTLSPRSNKTIIGKAPGVTLTGNIRIAGENVSNVIIRNLAVRGNRCNSYDECKAGADAVYIGNGAHHVWLDHLDIADGQDGNCDVTQGGDFVTVSWAHFHYTYAKEHRFSNLIAGSDDEPDSIGKLRITYMNSYWGERVDARQPRGRYGNVHMLNNYHKTGGSQIHGVGKDMALIAENNVYQESLSIWTDMGSPRGWKGMGNEGSASNMNTSQGSVFTIPYAYAALPASKVVAAVTAPLCGAGNNCTLRQ